MLKRFMLLCAISLVMIAGFFAAYRGLLWQKVPLKQAGDLFVPADWTCSSDPDHGLRFYNKAGELMLEEISFGKEFQSGILGEEQEMQTDPGAISYYYRGTNTSYFERHTVSVNGAEQEFPILFFSNYVQFIASPSLDEQTCMRIVRYYEHN